MHLKMYIINIILFVFCGFSHTQTIQNNELITNLSIYSKLLDKNLIQLENQFELLGRDKIYCIKIKGKPEINEYLYIKIRQKLNNYRVISDLDSSDSDFLVTFGNINFVTKYDKIFGSLIKSRKVQRKIEISYEYKIKRKNADSDLYERSFYDFNEDEFFLDRLEDIERGDYNFLKGKLPEQSFWERAFIPGIVILASAVAIILFFEIRSK